MCVYCHRTFLKHVKREISGMHFPAYYELVPNTSKAFNKNEVYSQQVSAVTLLIIP